MENINLVIRFPVTASIKSLYMYCSDLQSLILSSLSACFMESRAALFAPLYAILCSQINAEGEISLLV